MSASEPGNPAALPTARKFLIFGVMAFGQFMALLDIQIVAASLNDVQAGLSAGPDEISWVQTAYLMAELVMVPLSGFLARAISTRYLFALSAGLFTLSSALCGAAWDISSMILFRAIQGFVGGAMIPTVFATGFTLFTGAQRAMIPAILGLVAVLAPTLGPTVGGLITDGIGWRWIFYINVLPGIAVTVMVLLVARLNRPEPSLLRRIDYVHLLAMAVFLGTLEYVLEEGPRWDWFGDTTICIAAWVSLVGFGLFLERSFFSPNPVVRLTPFRNLTFAFACIFSLVIGFGMFAATYLIPVYLGRVRGYDSLQIGTTVFITGVAQIFSTLIAARLSQRVDMRLMITAGLSLFALSLWMTSAMASDWGFDALLWPQVVRGFSLMLCIVPSVNMALSGFPPAELGNASGLFTLMRNLGGAIGIAVVNSWLQDDTRLHALRFGEALSHYGRGAADALGALAQRFAAVTPDPVLAQRLASAEFAHLVGTNALTLAFNDTFRSMAWLFLFALVMVPFCRPAKNPPPASADAH